MTAVLAAWLGLNAGIAAAAVSAYRRHNRHLTDRRHAFDAHVADALAVAAPEPVCTCDGAVWTDAELVEYAPDLAVLDAVTTYDDFVYLTGGEA